MTYIPDSLRQFVAQRANGRCEYCLVHEDDSLYTHEIDHVIPEKHRGQTEPENLCFCCLECNRHKGSDFASFDPETEDIIPLFNPRHDLWETHFRLDADVISPLTAVGRVTVFILQLNHPLRVRARRQLIRAGRYRQS